MRNAIIVTAIAGVLAACSPEPTVPQPSSSSSTATASATSDTHKLETQAMAAHPGYARRDGVVLTLVQNGKDAVRLDDGSSKGCDAMDDCAGWTFRGVEHLLSTAGLDPNALVARDAGGERTRYTFIGSDPGLTWFYAWPSVSPSGQYIVSATDSGALVVYDWSTPFPHTMYDFGPDCTFLNWTSDSQAQARCAYPGGKATLATLALYGDVWRLSDTQEIDPAAGDIQPVEGSKLKKRVVIVHGAPSKAADEGELKTLGYQRLR